MAFASEQNITWPDGFKCIKAGNSAENILDCDIKNRQEFKSWLKIFTDINPVRWNAKSGTYKLKNGSEVLSYKCHHADLKQTGARVTNTK